MPSAITRMPISFATDVMAAMPPPDLGLVSIPHQRHIELHDFRLQRDEAREAGIPRAEIVDRDAEAELAERVDAFLDVLHVVEGGALGDLQDYASRDLRQGRREIIQVRVEQIARVQVDEEQRRVVGRGLERGCAQVSHAPPEVL